MWTASESDMSPLLAILVLRNTKVHVDFSNSYDLPIYIKAFINKTPCFHTILRIPNINPYNSYVWFKRYLDNI